MFYFDIETLEAFSAKKMVSHQQRVTNWAKELKNPAKDTNSSSTIKETTHLETETEIDSRGWEVSKTKVCNLLCHCDSEILPRTPFQESHAVHVEQMAKTYLDSESGLSGVEDTSHFGRSKTLNHRSKNTRFSLHSKNEYV